MINLYSHFAMGFAPDVTVSGSAAVWLTGPAVPVILIVDAPGEAVGEAVRDKVVVPFGPDVIFDVTPAYPHDCGSDRGRRQRWSTGHQRYRPPLDVGA